MIDIGNGHKVKYYGTDPANATLVPAKLDVSTEGISTRIRARQTASVGRTPHYPTSSSTVGATPAVPAGSEEERVTVS